MKSAEAVVGETTRGWALTKRSRERLTEAIRAAQDEAFKAGAEAMREKAAAPVLASIAAADYANNAALLKVLETVLAAIRALPVSGAASVSQWRTMEDAPLAVWGLVWHPSWRRAFPGMRNGDNGAVWIDTCETETRGRQDYATHWMPLPTPPTGETK